MFLESTLFPRTSLGSGFVTTFARMARCLHKRLSPNAVQGVVSPFKTVETITIARTRARPSQTVRISFAIADVFTGILTNLRYPGNCSLSGQRDRVVLVLGT